MTNWLVALFGLKSYSVFESRLPYLLQSYFVLCSHCLALDIKQAMQKAKQWLDFNDRRKKLQYFLGIVDKVLWQRG